MKKLLACALMGLALSTSAYAAPAAKDAPAVKASSANKELAGAWVSTERTSVVAPGTMTFTEKGDITLAPEGFDPLKGTYTVQGQFIDVTTDRGRATLIYKIEKDKMALEYENGSVQNFTKQPAASSATPAKKKAK
jgi:hypothetical protein